MTKHKFKKGDIVEILHPSEIAKTLDSNGTLDNLPFMAEMIPYCGKKFKVSARLEKTCVECKKPDSSVAEEMRAFLTDDVVALENLRCSGSSHGGCQTGCVIFWKEAWLKKADDKVNSPDGSEKDESQLQSKLKERDNTGRYFCQATQLASSTRVMSSKDKLVKLFNETLTGDISVMPAIKSVIKSPIRRIIPAASVKGLLTKTPAESLNLQAGEVVEVKPYDEILKTLDKQGRNKGLAFTYLMKEYCGKTFTVRNRLERMMNEATGEMKEIKNTVNLEGVVCKYENRFLGCPRQRFHIWREIWLRRAEPNEQQDSSG